MADMDRLNQLSENVIGAAIEVHRHLGSGFLESTYERALSIELDLRGISHELQKPVALEYKGRSIGDGKVDLLIQGILVVELKAVKDLADAHKTQVLAYLKATDHRLGLLINFHSPLLKDGVARVVLDEAR
ncbi:MAG: GxxExxY protein [Phycisphaeraceae bacterium]